MIIIRTRQISPMIITRPKRLTLIIEYEYTEQIQHWYRFCQQHIISYLAYRTILPSFTVPGWLMFFMKKIFYLFISYLDDASIGVIEKISSSPVVKDEPFTLPTIVLARPLVDNFKLLRTLECR